MKEISELNLPEDLKYAEDHEWIKTAGDGYRIGISDFAQDQLGDITFAELPQVGDTFPAGDEFGTLESTKAVSELIMPIGGEVTAVNEVLEDSPDLVNSDPYGKGWLIEIKADDEGELDNLLDKGAYLDLLKNQE